MNFIGTGDIDKNSDFPRRIYLAWLPSSKWRYERGRVYRVSPAVVCIAVCNVYTCWSQQLYCGVRLLILLYITYVRTYVFCTVYSMFVYDSHLN